MTDGVELCKYFQQACSLNHTPFRVILKNTTYSIIYAENLLITLHTESGRRKVEVILERKAANNNNDDRLK